MAVIRYSRFRHLVLTLADLGLVVLAALGIQHPDLAVAIPCWLLLALASLFFLAICREWLSSSRIDLEGRNVVVEWGNWRIDGRIESAAITEKRPRKLALVIADAKAARVPVGPLFIVANFILGPLLRPLLPIPPAGLYCLDKRRLLAVQSDGTGRAVLSFPLILFGRRRVSHVLESALG